LLVVGEGSAVPDSLQSVHDLKHGAGSYRLGRSQCADERSRVCNAVAVGASDIGKRSVGDVLEAARDAGGAVILHVRDVDDLRDVARDRTNDIRSGIFLAKEVDFDIHGGIVGQIRAAGALGSEVVHA